MSDTDYSFMVACIKSVNLVYAVEHIIGATVRARRYCQAAIASMKTRVEKARAKYGMRVVQRPDGTIRCEINKGCVYGVCIATVRS